MKNKEKKNKSLITAFVIIFILLLVIIGILLWMLFGKSEGKKVDSVANSSAPLTIGTPDENRDSIEIVTKYGTLLYPKEWESNLRIEIIDKEEYKVEFYGAVKGKEELHIFDLNFNGPDGYNLGTLKTDSGEDVQLNIVSYDFDFDDTWTEDEKNVIYAMSEDINYIIGMLAESGKLTIFE